MIDDMTLDFHDVAYVKGVPGGPAGVLKAEVALGNIKFSKSVLWGGETSEIDALMTLKEFVITMSN